MSELVIDDLHASVGGTEILSGITLAVRGGEVHAVMGPNGSGKSTLSNVLMGHPGYTVTGGAVTLDGVDVLALAPHERARAGLFLGMQYPIEVPGVPLMEMFTAAIPAGSPALDDLGERVRAEAERIGFDARFLERPLNVDLSGGEKKRNETLQMAVLHPKVAILDEIDSGLDIDALRAVSRRVEAATNEDGLGVLAITHYARLLSVLRADRVHVLVGGRIVEAGGPELADRVDTEGYEAFIADAPPAETAVSLGGLGTAGDPFADPLA